MRTAAQRDARRRRRRNRRERERVASSASVESLPLCPCGEPARLVTGAELYPHRSPELDHVRAWVHDACSTRVGCHPGTVKPLGSLVDAETRAARMRAHHAFDPLWRGQGKRARLGAYRWLADALRLHPDATHIGMFDAETCERVVEACEARAAAELDAREATA